MDGRLLDPTSAYYDKLKLRTVKAELVAAGVNFARHYTASPQCVPSRTSMVTSRYAHELDTTNNGQGIAASPKTGRLDSGCVKSWGAPICSELAARQRVNYTFLDRLEAAGYDMQLFARFDTGAGVLDDWPAHGPTGDGFHNGPELGILARGANIAGATKEEPLNATRTADAQPYAVDQRVGADVVDFLTRHDPASAKPFFLWMGLLAPHPPYSTNASYLAHVNTSSVDAPPLVARAATHPYDRQMSVLKNVWQHEYSDADVKRMRAAYWGAVGEAMLIVETVLEAARATGHLNNVRRGGRAARRAARCA